MTKQSFINKTTTSNNATTETAGTTESAGAALLPPAMWLLKSATASKLGKYAEGGIDYQVTADVERTALSIAITGNSGGGYFSRERVPFAKIEACVSKCEAGKPFASKALADAFEGRSSNNAGFIVAALRAEGLLGPAPEAETQHVLTGDWAAWKKAMLAEVGTLIEPKSAAERTQHPSSTPVEDHSKAPKQNSAKKA